MKIKTLVVNMDKDTTKWQEMQKKFNFSCLDLERFRATNGKEEDIKDVSLMCGMFCSAGIKGCFDSHRRIWKKVVEDRLPLCIVLEDDVYPADNFETGIFDAYSQLPEKWDVFLLGYHSHGTDINTKRFSLIENFYSLCCYLMGNYRGSYQVNENVYVPESPSGTYGYMISYLGAEKLLKLCPQITWHVDISMYNKKELNLYSAYPKLVKHIYNDTNLGVQSNPLVKSIFSSTRLSWGDFSSAWICSEPIFQIGNQNITLWLLLNLFAILLVLSILFKTRKPLYLILGISVFILTVVKMLTL
jgi:glycosyl transferase family 25